MGKVTFFLNKSKGTPEHRPIYLNYNFNGQRLKYFTGKFASETHFTLNKLNPVKGDNDSLNINTNLGITRKHIGAIENEALAAKQILTPDFIRERLDELIKARPKPIIKKTTLSEFMETFIENFTSRINKRTGAKLSHRTQSRYRSFKNMYDDFCEYKGQSFDFSDIDQEFITEIVKYMMDTNDNAVNTYGRYIGNFKTILLEAEKAGLHTNYAYKDLLSRVSEQSENIYLSESELEIIYKHDFKNNPSLERVRDSFIIGCWTGLRFADFSSLQPSDIKGDRIRVKTQKTRQKVVIPIHPSVKEIIEKYNYILPEPISNQKFNEYLKKVAEKSGLNEPTNKHITKGGIPKIISKPKYQFVSSHTARRSFATNAVKRGIPIHLIMVITGHKTETEFWKYVKLQEEEKADLFAESSNW